MANYEASVTLRFHDLFSSGMSSAANRISSASDRISGSSAGIAASSSAAAGRMDAAADRMGASYRGAANTIDAASGAIGDDLGAAGRAADAAGDRIASAGDRAARAWRAVDFAADLGAASAEVSQLADQVGRMADANIEVTAGVQGATSDLRTVITDDGAIAAIVAAAERTAAQQSDAGRLAAVSVDEFLQAAFASVSSGVGVDAGIAPQAAIALADQAALLGLAGQTDAATAAKNLAVAFNVFGDQEAIAAAADPLAAARAEMERMSDVLATTQDSFAFTGGLEQLTSGFKNVAGLAAAFEVPLEQTSAMIGVLNSMGIEGPEAGTALKSALAQLAPAAEKLGFTLAETASGGLDAIGTLRGVAAAGFSATELTKAFGTEAGPAVMHLTRQLAMLEGGYERIRAGAGTTMDNARIAAETYDQSVAQLGASFELLQSRIGAGGLAVRQAGVDAATFLVTVGNRLAEFSPALASAAGGMLEIAAAGGRGLAGVLEISTGVLSLTTLLGKDGPLLPAIGSIGARAASIIPAIATWTASMWAAAAAHIAVAWPIYAIVAGVALLAAGAYLVVKHWDQVSAFFAGLWSAVSGAFRSAFERIGAFLDGIRGPALAAMVVFMPIVGIPLLIRRHWGALSTFFAGVWSSVTGSFAAAWGRIRGLLEGPFNSIVGFFGDLWGSVAGIWRGAWDSFAALVRSGLERVVRLFSFFWTIRDFFRGVWDAITEVFRGAWDRINNLFGPDTLLGRIFGTMAADPAAAQDQVNSAMGETLSVVPPWLAQSDAERGPLSRLTAAGRAIPATIAAGIIAGAPVLAAALPPALGELTPLLLPAAAAPPDLEAGYGPVAPPLLPAAGALDLEAGFGPVAPPLLPAAAALDLEAGFGPVAPPLLPALGPLELGADAAAPARRVSGAAPPGAGDLVAAMRELAAELRAARAGGKGRGISVESLEIRLDESGDLFRSLEGLAEVAGESL